MDETRTNKLDSYIHARYNSSNLDDSVKEDLGQIFKRNGRRSSIIPMNEVIMLDRHASDNGPADEEDDDEKLKLRFTDKFDTLVTKIFEEIDETDEGSLSREQVTSALQIIGVQAPEEGSQEEEQLQYATDLNDFKKYVLSLMKKQKGVSRSTLAEADMASDIEKLRAGLASQKTKKSKKLEIRRWFCM